MDSVIHTTTLQGSPILAFGVSPPVSPKRKLLLAAIALVSLFAIGLILTMTIQIPLPSRVVFIASVRGDMSLLRELPRAWESVKEHTLFPNIIGLAMDDERLVPFAFHPSAHGLLTFESDVPISRSSHTSLAEVLWLLAHTLVAPGYIQFDGKAIDERIAVYLAGPVEKSGVWKTNAKLAPAAFQDLPPHDIAINLDALPEAWPFLQFVTHQMGFSLDESERPALFGWTSATSSPPLVELTFNTTPSTTTALAFASAAGLFDSKHTQLPDGVVIEELRRPLSLLYATSSIQLDLESGLTLVFADRILTTQSPQQPIAIPSCHALGRPLFHLSGSVLRTALQAIQLQTIPLRLFEAYEADGKLFFAAC